MQTKSPLDFQMNLSVFYVNHYNFLRNFNFFLKYFRF